MDVSEMETVHANDESFEKFEADTSNESTQHSDEEFAESDERIAFRPHRLGYDPMTYGSELSHEKGWKELEEISPKSERRSMKDFTGKSDQGDHKTHSDSINFDCVPPKEPIYDLKILIGRVFSAFARLSRASFGQTSKMTLLEESEARVLLCDNEQLQHTFFSTLSVPAQKFISRVLLGNLQCCTVAELRDARESPVQDSGGTYICVLLNQKRDISAVYVGRSQSLLHRFKGHYAEIAKAVYSVEHKRRLESFFHQYAAFELEKEGSLYFLPANILAAPSKESNLICAIFEAFLSCLLGTYRKDKRYLHFRAEIGLPAVSYIGLNSTPCMEQPQSYSQQDKFRPNPSIAPIACALHNTYLYYGILCRSGQNSLELERIKSEYNRLYTLYLKEVARLLQSGEFQLRIKRSKSKMRGQTFFSWKASNFGGFFIPKYCLQEILKRCKVDNDTQQPLFLSIQLLVGGISEAVSFMNVLKADAALLIAIMRQTDLFPSMPQSYQKMYGGLKLLLKDLDIHLQFHSIFHRTKWLLKFADRLIRYLPKEESAQRLIAIEEHNRSTSRFLGKEKDVGELLMGSLPLSRQGRAIIAFLNCGERLPIPFADDVRTLFSRVNEEKEFFFLKLEFGSNQPLWEGPGLPLDMAESLKGVGLMIFSTSLDRWVQVFADFRLGTDLSKFTKLASKAALKGKAQFQTDAHDLSKVVELVPSAELDEDDPAFKILTRTLPSNSSRRIHTYGRDSPRIFIPIKVVSKWFPELNYPSGQRISVKIEGKTAKTADEVKILVRLDSSDVGQNIGVWYNILSYTRSQKPTKEMWNYIQRRQNAST